MLSYQNRTEDLLFIPQVNMTSLQEIETLYHKAMREAKLSKSAAVGPVSPGYSIEEFSQWTRTVDVYNLGKGAADFALQKHEEIVQEFGDYRHNVTEKISKEFTYMHSALPGHLKDIGSCWDGSKVGTVNEMDSFYVMHHDFVTVRDSDKYGMFHVFLRQESMLYEIQPREMRDFFADKYAEVISQMELPKCLQHGGYNSSKQSSPLPSHPLVGKVVRGGSVQDSAFPDPRFSGVRYNGPAATSQFLTKDKTLLTWDVTPVVVLHNAAEIYETVRKSIQPIIAENPDKMFPRSDIHLIPDATKNLWRLSTAQMEADVLRVLSKEAPFKKALSFCKILSALLKRWCKRVGGFSDLAVAITKELDECLAMHDPSEKARAIQKLNIKMRYAHVWMPGDAADEYHEDEKCDISVNNAAVKYILFKAACSLKGAFSPLENMDIVKGLMRMAFQVLGNEKEFSSEHGFLPGFRISHFSIAARAAARKLDLARDVCRQCNTLLHESLQEVQDLKLFVD